MLDVVADSNPVALQPETLERPASDRKNSDCALESLLDEDRDPEPSNNELAPTRDGRAAPGVEAKSKLLELDERCEAPKSMILCALNDDRCSNLPSSIGCWSPNGALNFPEESIVLDERNVL